MNHKQKTVIVLGPPRSGTSLTSALLNILGIDMGRVSSSVKSNPKGDWEDLDFLELNKKIIAATGNTPHLDVPTTESLNTVGKTFTTQIQQLVNNKARGKTLWGWKDPHTTLTTELLLPHITNPHIIAVSRNVHDTALSYHKLLKGQILFDEALTFVKEYTNRVSHFVSKHPKLPVLHISFDNLIAHPAHEAATIAQFLDIPYTDEKRAAVENFVIPREKVETEKKKAQFKRKLLHHLPRSIWKKLTGK